MVYIPVVLDSILLRRNLRSAIAAHRCFARVTCQHDLWPSCTRDKSQHGHGTGFSALPSSGRQASQPSEVIIWPLIELAGKLRRSLSYFSSACRGNTCNLHVDFWLRQHRAHARACADCGCAITRVYIAVGRIHSSATSASNTQRTSRGRGALPMLCIVVIVCSTEWTRFELPAPLPQVA